MAQLPLATCSFGELLGVGLPPAKAGLLIQLRMDGLLATAYTLRSLPEFREYAHHFIPPPSESLSATGGRPPPGLTLPTTPASARATSERTQSQARPSTTDSQWDSTRLTYGSPQQQTTAWSGLQLPESLTYDGIGNWRAFYAKFANFASHCGWSPEERKLQLCLCLEGRAADFYCSLMDHEPYLEFADIIQRLRKRFDYRDLPETSQLEFASARQTSKETVKDWANRVEDLAMLAFPELPSGYVQQQEVMRFCAGALDQEAGFHVLNRRPPCIGDALEMVQRYQLSHRLVYGHSQYNYPRRFDIGSSQESHAFRVHATARSTAHHPATPMNRYVEPEQKTRYCYECRQSGHVARDCTTPDLDPPSINAVGAIAGNAQGSVIVADLWPWRPQASI